MTLTLLLDLDDTLLTTDTDFFQGAYLKTLSRHLGHRVDIRSLGACLMASTQAMIEHDDPDQTLEQVFDASFYPSLGVSRKDFQADIDQFYGEVFPSMQALTSPRNDAIRLVEQAFERGYQVAVATNPLFPYTAIAQRLEWAGLSPDRFPFKVISSYETFHFTKPNPAYYTEILAQMGWPEGPIIMVGNDVQDDILPAAELGIQTYLIHPNEPFQLPSGTAVPGQVGTLPACLDWLATDEVDQVQPDFNHPAALLAILKSTPAAIATLTRGLPLSVWQSRPQPEEWSLTEIICHLRDVELEVNLPRLRKTIEEANPFIPGKDTDPWAEERGYIHQDGRAALDAFLQARMQLLGVLKTFSREDWDCQVRHAIFGPTAVKELVGFMTTHDRNHVEQVLHTIESVKQSVR